MQPEKITPNIICKAKTGLQLRAPDVVIKMKPDTKVTGHITANLKNRNLFPWYRNVLLYYFSLFFSFSAETIDSKVRKILYWMQKKMILYKQN